MNSIKTARILLEKNCYFGKQRDSFSRFPALRKRILS